MPMQLPEERSPSRRSQLQFLRPILIPSTAQLVK